MKYPDLRAIAASLEQPAPKGPRVEMPEAWRTAQQANGARRRAETNAKVAAVLKAKGTATLMEIYRATDLAQSTITRVLGEIGERVGTSGRDKFKPSRLWRLKADA